MDKNKKELLDIIALKVGCDYLSDLNLPFNTTTVKQAVEAIEEEQYNLQQWKNAVRYIVGKEVAVDTPEQAKAAILAKLGTG